jgi:2-oxoglutarate ferredoxin oxidoreductase subunit delta
VKQIKSRGTVTIDVDHCKGCELCIPACPPAVLTMSAPINRMGYHYPELTRLHRCACRRMPGLFEVFRFNEPVITEVEI